MMQTVMLRIFLYFGRKLFQFVDIYCPDKGKTVVGITFTNSQVYLDKISGVEEEK